MPCLPSYRQKDSFQKGRSVKIFLSALEGAQRTKVEGGGNIAEEMVRQGIKMKYNLMSYYYIRANKRKELAVFIRDHTDEILIDSGAHSFQKGVKVDWDKYTQDYAEFIKEFDRPNVVGFFEMDVDNIIGYEKVKELRAVLTAVSDKIIPVWHRNRGVEDFKEMCRSHAGKVVAITGFKNEDIKDHQYLMFTKYAHEQGCRIHCLGMTRKKVLDACPFDYTDSSSWSALSRFGRIQTFGGRKCSMEFSKTQRGKVFIENYKYGMEMQKHYHDLWRKECKD